MKQNTNKQYTIRSVPPAVDHALRKQAATRNKSLNEVALDALRCGVGLGNDAAQFDDLDDCIGTWRNDARFEAAIKRQRKVDRKLWR